MTAAKLDGKDADSMTTKHGNYSPILDILYYFLFPKLREEGFGVNSYEARKQSSTNDAERSERDSNPRML